jgi:acetylornithine deacetylase/succinyl-diaminopimelate desuccinylase-like protein
MLHTTLAPTLFQSGFRRNALPTEASATLDLRALPDEDMKELQKTLYQVISDPSIKIELTAVGRPPGIPTGLKTPLYAAMEQVQQAFPDAVTLPMMLTGATDGAQLREKGVQVYGIDTIEEGSDTERMHGMDERVSVAGLQAQALGRVPPLLAAIISAHVIGDFVNFMRGDSLRGSIGLLIAGALLLFLLRSNICAVFQQD